MQTRIFGPIGLPNVARPQFSTSPSFVESRFAKQVSTLMDPALHPEKQLYGPWNEPLVRLTKLHKARFLCRWFHSPYISDIGRAWHLSKNVRPQIIQGRLQYS